MNRSLLIQLFVLLKQQTQLQHAELSPLQNMLHRVRTCLIQHAELAYYRQWLMDWTGYHNDYISHAFREEFGLSPHDYHLQMKIERAMELLEHTKLTVSAIGDQLQFSSIHYFSKAFKKHVGQSPLKYRKNG
jgi:AraC-like DNA-binding protein